MIKEGFVGEVTFELALNGWDFDKGRCFLSRWNGQWTRDTSVQGGKKKVLVH